MPDPSIRAETPSDRDAIWDVTAAAFGREQEARSRARRYGWQTSAENRSC